jgi:hypothetical protein
VRRGRPPCLPACVPGPLKMGKGGSFRPGAGAHGQPVPSVQGGWQAARILGWAWQGALWEEGRARTCCLSTYVSLRHSHTSSCPSRAQPSASQSPAALNAAALRRSRETERVWMESASGSCSTSKTPCEKPATSTPVGLPGARGRGGAGASGRAGREGAWVEPGSGGCGA